MDASNWEDLREEICTQLQIGMSKGETELETMTRFVWMERQNNLEAIEKAVADALTRERGSVARKGKVLQWKPSFDLTGRSHSLVKDLSLPAAQASSTPRLPSGPLSKRRPPFSGA